MIALFVKRNLGRRDVLDESLVFGAVAERMEKLGFPEGAISIQMEKLRSFGGERLPKKVKLTEKKEFRDESEESSDEYMDLLKAHQEGHFGELKEISSDDEDVGEVKPKDPDLPGNFCAEHHRKMPKKDIAPRGRMPQSSWRPTTLTLRWWAMTHLPQIGFTNHVKYVSQEVLQQHQNPQVMRNLRMEKLAHLTVARRLSRHRT